MENNKRIWVGLGIVGAIILAAGSVLWLRPVSSPQQNATTTPSGTGSSTTLGNGISVKTTGNGTIALVTGTPAPSLTRPITISSSLPSDAATALRNHETTLLVQLTQNPRRVDLWLNLGVDRKIAGDYQGALDAWTYVAKTGPNTINYIAYGDMGDLYMNFLKNYPKAEANYKAAIAINPHVIDYYRSLYTMYKYLYKTNTTAAANILTQGLQANPNNADLLTLQRQAQGQ